MSLELTEEKIFYGNAGTRKRAAKDYIVFLGMIGGAAAIFFPTGAWGYSPFRLE